MNSAAHMHLIWFCTKLVKMWTSTEITKAPKVLQSCQMDRWTGGQVYSIKAEWNSG